MHRLEEAERCHGPNLEILLPGGSTLPETNIAPENGWLEYYFHIGEAYFQGQAVSFREGR